MQKKIQNIFTVYNPIGLRHANIITLPSVGMFIGFKNPILIRVGY